MFFTPNFPSSSFQDSCGLNCQEICKLVSFTWIAITWPWWSCHKPALSAREQVVKHLPAHYCPPLYDFILSPFASPPALSDFNSDITISTCCGVTEHEYLKMLKKDYQRVKSKWLRFSKPLSTVCKVVTIRLYRRWWWHETWSCRSVLSK